jgi:hypothetical protein
LRGARSGQGGSWLLILGLPSGAKCNNVESAIKCVRCGGVKQIDMQKLEPYSGAAILDSGQRSFSLGLHMQRSLSLGLQTAIGIAGGSYIWGFRCSDDNRWVYMCAQTCFAKYPPRTSKSLHAHQEGLQSIIAAIIFEFATKGLTQRHTQHVHSIRCWDVTYISIFNYSIGICGSLFRGRDTCGMLCTITVVRGNDGASRHYSGGPMACWQPLNSGATGSRTSSANHMSSPMCKPQRTRCSRQLACQTRQLCTHPALDSLA